MKESEVINGGKLRQKDHKKESGQFWRNYHGKSDDKKSDDKNIINDELPVNFVISGLRRINCEARSLAVPKGADYAITSFKSSPWGGPPMEGS